MDIPVFVSCPTSLSDEQNASRALILRQLKRGGVFDPGVSDVFIHEMPSAQDSRTRKEALGDVFLKWQAEVRRHYYGV